MRENGEGNGVREMVSGTFMRKMGAVTISKNNQQNLLLAKRKADANPVLRRAARMEKAPQGAFSFCLH